VNRAIFMDRDGTVSEEIGYMYEAALYRPFPWTGEAIRQINDSGFKAVLITNQSGVERGFFPESTVHAVHDILRNELARCNARLDAIYYCPHRPETGCGCRKPQPGMLLKAAEDLKIDLQQSFMIGDRYIDVHTAYAAGVRPVLVRTGDGKVQLEKYGDGSDVQPDFVADDLLEAVKTILAGDR